MSAGRAIDEFFPFPIMTPQKSVNLGPTGEFTICLVGTFVSQVSSTFDASVGTLEELGTWKAWCSGD